MNYSPRRQIIEQMNTVRTIAKIIISIDVSIILGTLFNLLKQMTLLTNVKILTYLYIALSLALMSVVLSVYVILPKAVSEMPSMEDMEKVFNKSIAIVIIAVCLIVLSLVFVIISPILLNLNLLGHLSPEHNMLFKNL